MFDAHYDVNYCRILHIVYKIIIELAVKQLPVSVDYITQKLEIKQIRNCDLNKPLLEQHQNGLVVLINSKFYIIYNEKDDLLERRFTVAHELGHIFLEHLWNNKHKSKQQQEYEADIFATLLLAPVCVVQQLHLQTPEQIQAICNIP